MKLICSIILIFLCFASCKPVQVFAQELKPIKPVIELQTGKVTLKEHTLKVQLKSKEETLDKLKKTNHLLRVEIDALKKNMLQLEVDYKIDKVNKSLDKITKE